MGGSLRERGKLPQGGRPPPAPCGRKPEELTGNDCTYAFILRASRSCPLTVKTLGNENRWSISVQNSKNIN